MWDEVQVLHQKKNWYKFWYMSDLVLYYTYLGGGFKDVLLSALVGEMIQFDEHIFQMGWNHELATIMAGSIPCHDTPCKMRWNPQLSTKDEHFT